MKKRQDRKNSLPFTHIHVRLGTRMAFALLIAVPSIFVADIFAEEFDDPGAAAELAMHPTSFLPGAARFGLPSTNTTP